MAQSFDIKYDMRYLRRAATLTVDEAGLAIQDLGKSKPALHRRWDEITVSTPPSGLEHVTVALNKISPWKARTWGLYFTDKEQGINTLRQAMTQYHVELHPATAIEESSKRILITVMSIIIATVAVASLYLWFKY